MDNTMMNYHETSLSKNVETNNEFLYDAPTAFEFDHYLNNDCMLDKF